MAAFRKAPGACAAIVTAIAGQALATALPGALMPMRLCPHQPSLERATGRVGAAPAVRSTEDEATLPPASVASQREGAGAARQVLRRGKAIFGGPARGTGGPSAGQGLAAAGGAGVTQAIP